MELQDVDATLDLELGMLDVDVVLAEDLIMVLDEDLRQYQWLEVELYVKLVLLLGSLGEDAIQVQVWDGDAVQVVEKEQLDGDVMQVFQEQLDEDSEQELEWDQLVVDVMLVQ